MPLMAAAKRAWACASIGLCRTIVLAGSWPRKLPSRQLRAGRTGRGTNPPPQFGQTLSRMRSTHVAQNVHSYEQMRASGEFAGNGLLQFSHVGLNSSMLSKPRERRDRVVSAGPGDHRDMVSLHDLTAIGEIFLGLERAAIRTDDLRRAYVRLSAGEQDLAQAETRGTRQRQAQDRDAVALASRGGANAITDVPTLSAKGSECRMFDTPSTCRSAATSQYVECATNPAGSPMPRAQLSKRASIASQSRWSNCRTNGTRGSRRSMNSLTSSRYESQSARPGETSSTVLSRIESCAIRAASIVRRRAAVARRAVTGHRARCPSASAAARP